MEREISVLPFTGVCMNSSGVPPLHSKPTTAVAGASRELTDCYTGTEPWFARDFAELISFAMSPKGSHIKDFVSCKH